MKLTNKAYDVLKWIATYFLPAVGTLYFALARIWNFPYGEEIVGSITAVDAFLGAILGISSSSYKGDGEIIFDTTSDDSAIVLDDVEDVRELAEKGMITLKVKLGKTS